MFYYLNFIFIIIQFNLNKNPFLNNLFLKFVQPGVATMARDNCPSCGVQLEYTRSFGNTTQVQCYECQALVEFDH